MRVHSTHSMQAGQASQMIINTESKASESHHAQAQK